MPVVLLRIDRDDFFERRPEGWVGFRDPGPAPAREFAEPGQFEILLDGDMLGVLDDFEALLVEVEPGAHVVASRGSGREGLICEVAYTAAADSYYDVQTSFLCRSDGVLDGPHEGRSRSVKTVRASRT